MTSTGACLTDDNVMQKLDAGAILVNGKEELPLGYGAGVGQDDNARVSPDEVQESQRSRREERRERRGIPIPDERGDDAPLPRRRRPRHRPRRYYSDEEILGVHSMRKSHDDTASTNGIGESDNSADDNRHPRLADGDRDRNANARVTRANTYDCGQRQSATLPRRRRRRAMSGSIIGNPLPPHRVTPDGTAIYYWCELPRRPGSQGKFIPVTKRRQNLYMYVIYDI